MDLATLLASAIHDAKNELHLLSPDIECLLDHSDEKVSFAAANIGRRINDVDRRLVRLLLLYRFSAESGTVGINLNEMYVSDLLNSLPGVESPEGEGLATDAQSNRVAQGEPLICDVDCNHELIAYFDERLVSAVLRDALDNARRYARDSNACFRQGIRRRCKASN